MIFIELPRFSKRLPGRLMEDGLQSLQNLLISTPRRGGTIPGSGGWRKIRYAARGKGTRGGARVIYYFYDKRQQIFFFDLYVKNEKADLSRDEIKQLKQLAALIKST